MSTLVQLAKYRILLILIFNSQFLFGVNKNKNKKGTAACFLMAFLDIFGISFLNLKYTREAKEKP
jgi:hypothetical protein